METTMPIISLGAAAFWIALAAVLIAGSWFKSRREALKHDTLLRLVEKTGRIDEEQLKILFPPPVAHPLPPHHPWLRPPAPPGSQRAGMRIVGTVALSVGIGLALFFAIVFRLGTVDMRENAIWGLGWAALFACIGVGLLAAGQFFPAANPGERGDRETP